MSDVDKVPEDVDNTTEEVKFPPVAGADWYLQSLIDIVNGNDLEFPITLYVDGLIVSGYLASGHRYFDGLGLQLRQFFGDGDNAEDNVAFLTQPRETYLIDKETSPPLPPQYVHVREARVFMPGQNPIPQEGVWWRGRVSRVSGFNFGSMGINKS